ncbi:MAG TPA: SpoIIE family protein phosphatase [Williamwhitmania sp.]|nr:SpoIIE family protein phosphatase [Williamwhitmania sp.]
MKFFYGALLVSAIWVGHHQFKNSYDDGLVEAYSHFFYGCSIGSTSRSSVVSVVVASRCESSSGNRRTALDSAPPLSSSESSSETPTRNYLVGLFLVFVVADLSYVLVSLHIKVLFKERRVFEETVRERTADLAAQGEKLQRQRDLLKTQHDEIEQFHTQLSDSMEFAKHLQDSHLQNKSELDMLCGDHFIIYQPKYSVGGDFYWSSVYDNNVIFCVVDCTGHGIPGALMSMVGLVAFKDVVLNQRIVSPAAVLGAVHHKMVTTLSIATPSDTVTSAMDVAFCMLNRSEGKLWFAGAHCPIFLIKNCESEFPSLQELPGDKRLVGNPLFRGPFKEHCLDVEPGDMIYLFTDGLVDQLEQHERRKFSRNLARKMFVQLCALPTAIQRQEIVNRIAEWKGSDVQTDDITVLGIRV